MTGILRFISWVSDTPFSPVMSGEEETLKRLADCTRSIALLKSNEAIMVRRFKAVSDSEADLKKHCQKLKDDMVSAENGMIEKMGVLQR